MENLGKLKNLVYTSLLAIFMLIVSLYVYGIESFRALGFENQYLNSLFIAINTHYKIFNSQLVYKLMTLLFLFPGLLFGVNDPVKNHNKIYTILFLLIGLIVFLIPTKGWWYIGCSISGFLSISVALCHINMGPRVDSTEDPFNELEESFPQEEQILKNKYSVNLPMHYYLKDSHNKLQKRHGWLNIVNIFKGVAVLGLPGSGKTFCVIEPIMQQLTEKGFCMAVYDFKFPVLAKKAYNYYLKALKEKSFAKINPNISARFYCINFDNPAYSHRCNPISPNLLKDDADSLNIAINVMCALNPEWRRNADFFANSAMNIYCAILMYLRSVEDGRFCTFAHANELLSVDLDRLIPILLSKKQLENITRPFQNAFISGAVDQIAGQIASAQIPLARLSMENIYFVCTGNDFELDVNDPHEPKIVVIGNNSRKVEAYATPLSLYFYQIIQQVNQANKWPCCLSIDEFPTVYLANIDRLINTARSNKVATVLGYQDNTQLIKEYGEQQAKVVISTIGNVFAGQVQAETAEFLSKFFGKKIQQRNSHSISESSISLSIAEQMEETFPVSKITTLSQGQLIGKVSDNFDQRIKEKLFSCTIDTDKMKIDESNFKEIPILTHFSKDAPEPYYSEWLAEFSARFNNEDVDDIMQIIMDKSDDKNVYRFNIEDFNINDRIWSITTKLAIQQKYNVNPDTSNEKLEVLTRYMDFLIGRLQSIGFILPTGGNNEYYVTIWMRAFIRENYYQVKKDIEQLVDRTEQMLLANPETAKNYRTSYLKKIAQEYETEMNTEEVVADYLESSIPSREYVENYE